MTFDGLRQDLVVALRSLRSHPGYGFVVVLTLALGIAANTLIVSLMTPYLIRPLPFGDPERLVQLGQIDPVEGWDGARLSMAQFEDWKARAQGFEDLAAYHYTTKNVTGDAEAEQILAGVLTANTFDVLQVRAAVGRTFASDEGGPAGADVVVLSDGLWRRRFGGERGVIGQTIFLDGVAHTVIGIMPEAFNFPFGGVKMWIPMRVDASTEPRERDMHIPVGRLKAGWSREQAREECEAIQRELAGLYPETDGRFEGVSVKPLREALNFAYEIMRLSFLVLLGAVVCVLVIACVNVASLTLARIGSRRRDVAVRAALGASRSRLARQLVTESFLLAGVGGALGVVLASWGARSVGPLLPEDLFRVGEVRVDGTVLLFSSVLTILTPVFFGLLPALGATRRSLVSGLKAGGRGASGTLDYRRALVVAEIAMAIVLIGGTGLMIRSFLELQDVDLGFRPARVLSVQVAPPVSDYPTDGDRRRFFQTARAALETLPGVDAASFVTPLPMNHALWTIPFSRPDHVPDVLEDWPTAYQFEVFPGYFDAMGIALLRGRAFDEGDRVDTSPVVIVSQSLAQRYWPSESPLGKTLLVGDAPSPTLATVVGVAVEIKHSGFEPDPKGQLYLPWQQKPRRGGYFVVSFDGEGSDPATAIASVRQSLAAIDPNLPVTARAMEDIVAESALQWSLSSLLLGMFGAVALFLASLGIYGVMAYSVAERRREIGIRMALGATASDVRRRIVGDGLRLTGAGVAIGLVLAILAAWLSASMLFGVSPFDPVTFGAVVLLFVAMAIAASVVPATRAASTEPTGVLRYE